MQRHVLRMTSIGFKPRTCLRKSPEAQDGLQVGALGTTALIDTSQLIKFEPRSNCCSKIPSVSARCLMDTVDRSTVVATGVQFIVKIKIHAEVHPIWCTAV